MWHSQGKFQRKMIHVIILMCITISSISQCHKIHEHMTPDEKQSLFYTSDNEIVPTYQVVPVLHSPHDESPEVKSEVFLKVFGKNINLNLEPVNGLLSSGKHVSMWTVSRNDSSPDGLFYEEIPEGKADIGKPYQDLKNMASLLLHQDASGKILVDGNIGHELVIRPLPDRIIKEIIHNSEIYQEPHLLPNVPREKRNLSQTHHHVVFKRTSQLIDDEFSDFAFMEPDHLAKKFRSKRSINSKRSKRDAPFVIYPEILCIVDYDGYRLHGGDNVQIKRYFVSFWNGVDMRYKLLKGPKIRISIAGIIISRGRDATPYLERNRVGRDAIDSAAALTDMGKYLFRERRLPVYDIAVAVTKLDMCRRQYTNDVCNRGTAGFAYVGGACVVNKRLEKVNSVAIIEDTGGFSGIIVAAHEVGHLLGAVHDGSPPPSYLGGPGAEKCRWEDGYIMSDLRHTEKGFKWSHCSISSFHHFLNGDTATCLYNAPHEDEALPRVLPGKLLSLDAQCRKDRGTSACFKDDRVCAQLFCFDAGSGYCVAYRPAAEGSACGDGQYCLNGKCVAEHENIIPDYTQNIPKYVRQDSIYNNNNNGEIQNRPAYAQYNNTEYRYQWESTTQYSHQLITDYSTLEYTDENSPDDDLFYSSTPNYYSTTKNIYNFNYNNNNNNNHINNNDNDNDNDNYNNNIKSTPISYYRYNNDNDYQLTTKKVNNYYNYLFNVFSTTTSLPTVSGVFQYNYNDNSVKNKFTTTATTAREDQYDRLNPGRGVEDDECKDTATDCAELIDRLRIWLCHLKSVKIRCCVSLKSLCS